MIVTEQKPMEFIEELIKDCKKVLFLGCSGCVTVCLAGGEKETDLLATSLRMKREIEGNPLETVTYTCTRQCDPEYVDGIANLVEDVDAIVSLACGVGVQFVAEKYNTKWVVPAQNTKFAGGAVEHGVWEERCGLCGDCVLHKTGGICPIIRCSKSILNGPCGGSQYGKCEVSKDTDCAWHLIVEHMKELGKLDMLLEIQPPKDWSASRDGGPRKVVREDVKIDA
ncbi:methylenetetrahydrofolate reductase C-terminal domain-containing protein [Desulfolucanica intricata]|uniref:methylenetetrahydrofolate reductase C-terminal domain-containing protein n=1 Tax=Desulfolucanica intricata TaxID=1285191 RepID=UPI00082E9419|nr:methylenetetrahydrofolate reductase C-terminal domain-containing protein [Desulfolucanica intricata]